MGIAPFSSDFRDCSKEDNKKEQSIRLNSTPDPTNFKIIKSIVVNGYPIFWVRYPGVSNYEGNKILMYPKFFDTNQIKNKMDPHFFTEGDSPIARFEPTKYGWKLATTLAENL